MRRLRRSKLFVPGSRPELFGKAFASAADGISFDLEDAVADAQKEAARAAVAAALRDCPATAKERIVRVNPLRSGMMFDDIMAVACAALDVVNVPKVESPRDLHVAEELLGHLERKLGLARPIGLVPTIETPAGLRHAHAIATASMRVVGLQLGTGDLAAITGLQASTERLTCVRTMLVLAAAEAGVDALDSAFTAIADLAAFERDAEAARGLGLRGKSCIHPSQIAIANRVFGPGDAELRAARAMVAAYDEAVARGVGAISHDGKLVDYPIAAAARRMIQAAEGA
ncbi:MAG: CoA ester lyase [Alphaproteobacteria bacterium]|nr:CoA ester lyase [Alphaproteobacteria bacterium]